YHHCACSAQEPHTFPTRRSSDLSEALVINAVIKQCPGEFVEPLPGLLGGEGTDPLGALGAEPVGVGAEFQRGLARVDLAEGSLLDRKSTRLNSSHVSISYSVFCL